MENVTHRRFRGAVTRLECREIVFALDIRRSTRHRCDIQRADNMACARPIVATAAGGIPEIVEDGITGTLVPPRDAGAMAAAIVGLLRDEQERKRFGMAGDARVRAQFTVDRMIAETAAVYARVAGRHHEAGNSDPVARTGQPVRD